MQTGRRSDQTPVVAVLGATGGVGRHLCAAFAGAGYDVVAIARRPAPHTDGYHFRPIDVAGAAIPALTALLADWRADVVVNATGGWVLTEDAMRTAHVTLVERLVDAVAALDTRPRLVHIGSIHEYGPVPEGTSIGEDLTCDPGTSYARTKHAGSEAVLAAARGGQVDGVVLRVVNVCGPHTTPASFLGTVQQKLRAATPGESVLLEIADARRDYVDVRDVAGAVVRAAAAPVAGAVVNIGRGEAVPMLELVELLVRAAGLPRSAVAPRLSDMASKGGGWTCADIRLAGELLGWKPRVDLLDSMRDMWGAGGA